MRVDVGQRWWTSTTPHRFWHVQFTKLWVPFGISTHWIRTNRHPLSSQRGSTCMAFPWVSTAQQWSVLQVDPSWSTFIKIWIILDERGWHFHERRPYDTEMLSKLNHVGPVVIPTAVNLDRIMECYPSWSKLIHIDAILIAPTFIGTAINLDGISNERRPIVIATNMSLGGISVNVYRRIVEFSNFDEHGFSMFVRTFPHTFSIRRPHINPKPLLLWYTDVATSPVYG